jgi:hypothetical protein
MTWALSDRGATWMGIHAHMRQTRSYLKMNCQYRQPGRECKPIEKAMIVHRPDEYQYIIAFSTAFLDEVLGLLQKLAVPLLVQHLEEVLVRCVRLEMYILNVLSVWPMK